MASTELSISHLDRVIAQNGGYPPPELPGAFSATTARRQDMQLLSMVSTPQVALQVDYMAPGASNEHLLPHHSPAPGYAMQLLSIHRMALEVDKVAPGAGLCHKIRFYIPNIFVTKIVDTPTTNC